MTPSTQKRYGLFRRAWVRLVGESDAIERQLAATAREGAMLARIAHACAFLMLALFSAGSLVALAGDSMQAIAAGHATFPAVIAAGVSGLLVLCMDTAMLYAASILRLLATRRAQEEGRLHRWILGSVAILEASTYAYMSWRYEAPHDLVAWLLIVARSLAAPLLSVYLSLARPLPVTARDMLALAERIAGEGVLHDLARIAGDTSAPLADKVSLYSAAAVIAPAERVRLEALLEVAQRRETPQNTLPALEALPAPSGGDTDEKDDTHTRLPMGTGSPARTRRTAEPGLNPEQEMASKVVAMPRRRRRKSGAKRVARATAEPLVRQAFIPGMSAGELARITGISKGAASKWRKVLQTEADAAGVQAAR